MRPLVPEDLQYDPLKSLARVALAHARATLDRTANISDIVGKSWPDDFTAKLITKSPVDPTSTTAAPLVPVVQAFLKRLVPLSASADLLARCLSLKFGPDGLVSCPALSIGSASFISEGQPIPVLQGQSKPGPRLDLFKLACSTTLSGEMVRGSNAVALVQQAMLDTVAPALDAAMFSNAAAVPGKRPAGLFVGIAALTPAAGSNSKTDAMIDDVCALAKAIGQYAGNGGIVFVMSTGQATAAPMRANTFPYPLLQSSALPDRTLFAVAASALVAALDLPRVESSTQAAVHLEDVNPADIVNASGTPAFPTKSLFQVDAVGLRVVAPVSWAMRESGGLAWMQNVNW